jgi:hypothetical protein
MSHFTQLNLQGNSTGKPSPAAPKNPNPKPPRKEQGIGKLGPILGSLMLATLVVTFTLGTNSCSKKSASTTKSEMPSSPQPAALSTVPTPAPAPVATAKPAKKSPRQHKLSTYKNSEYGLTYRYPNYYVMKEGEALNPDQASQGAMNFVLDGGTTLSTVELPETLFANTDFDAATFSVSVNPKLTSNECEQFAFPEKISSDEAVPAKINIAGTEYHEMNDSMRSELSQVDARYFHIYQNNVCYEFALGVQTVGTDAKLKPVNRDKVFDKLQWMLSTVKIKQITTPEATPSVSASAPMATTEKTNQ